MKNKPKVVKKITDKQRLDWLNKNGEDLVQQNGSWWVYNSMHKWYKSPRQAIDATMKAEAKHEEK